MNLWRCLGITLFLLAAVFVVGSSRAPVYAGAKDKDKQVEKEKDKKVEDKKAEDKKTEPKKEEPKGKGETLEFKAFKKGAKPFYQEQKTKTTQMMKVMNQEVKQEQDQTFIIQWTPKEEDKDGNYVVTQKIVGIKMNIDIGGNKINYDSTIKNPKNPMTDFFEQLQKSELTFKIKPDLTVAAIEGEDTFIKGLTDINPQMSGLLKAILSKDALKKMAEPTWYAFPPGGTVTQGQTWDKKSELNLGPIGTYETNFKFKANEVEAKKAVIGITTSLKYSAPTDSKGLPFTILKASLTGDDGKGQASFDREKGRFESTKLEMKLSGELDIEVGNMQTKVNLTQTQDSSTRTFDENPWAEKK